MQREWMDVVSLIEQAHGERPNVSKGERAHAGERAKGEECAAEKSTILRACLTVLLRKSFIKRLYELPSVHASL